MGEQLLFWIICTVISGALGIIVYFLKRTMDRLDKVEEEIKNSVTRDDFKELTTMIQDLRDKFVSKEELKELKETIKEIKSSIDEIKKDTVWNKDFVRSITRLESMLSNRN